ncbi:hypothetical protein [Gordonia crocea]|uniref:SH3 domain-containing protein n=1 Tax=Gordonia crocea TaxID=589162 RepID=A0A7I9UVM3_9ACTN|nr:hypothetical protein [Gordonia crocea]GED97228.1 hypothetical protein nbrc107697_12670 [Gordonia crocea]
MQTRGFAAILATGAALTGVLLGTGQVAAQPVFTAYGGVRSVTVNARNDQPYNIMCETWIVGQKTGGDTFTVNARSRKQVRLRTTPGWKEAWLHCGRGSVGGPEVVRRSLGQVRVL